MWGNKAILVAPIAGKYAGLGFDFRIGYVQAPKIVITECLTLVPALTPVALRLLSNVGAQSSFLCPQSFSPFLKTESPLVLLSWLGFTFNTALASQALFSTQIQ